MASPIDTIGIDGENYHLPAYNDKGIMYCLKKKLDGIRYGREEDIYNWNFIVG